MDWGPTNQPQHLYKGFTVPSFNTDILLHDYLLHWDSQHNHNQELSTPKFLQTGGIEPPYNDSENSGDLFGSD
jgi:hypothetical protein